MYAQTTKDISHALQSIAAGRVVAFPTGTSYGLAVDALQGHALQRLRNLKHRAQDKSFTVCMADELFSQHLELTDKEEAFVDQHKNQPITLLVKPAASLVHIAKDGYIGLRFIDHPVMAELATGTGVPLTATSANVADQPACHTVECITTTFPGKVDETTYDLSLATIIDAGKLPSSKSSTILHITSTGINTIRPGAFTL